MSRSSPDPKSIGLLLFRLCVIGLVGWGIYRALLRAGDDLRENSFQLADLNVRWLLVAGGAYFLGLLPMSWFWYWLLRRMGQTPKLWETLRAYFVGHLGKYVPGKFFVVVIRTGLIRSQRVDSTVAAVSVMVETLTMMASGAFLAAACLIVAFPAERVLQLIAAGLMVATIVGTLPPVLKRALQILLRNHEKQRIDRVVARLGWSTVGIGWLVCWAGWILLAFSLWATIQSFPNVVSEFRTFDLASASRSLTSVSLALVAGFLSMLPGGIGVREWVIERLLGPVLGVSTALIVAVVLRVVWLLTEVAVSTILYLLPFDSGLTKPPPPDE